MQIPAQRRKKKIIPRIDQNKCEGKGACVEVCPYAVFQMYVLPTAARQRLTLRGKLKGLVHGWKQAEVVAEDLCQGCGLCVQACPEKAIQLVNIGNQNT